MADKFNIFGKNHDVIGSADSDLILRFKGNCKLLIGNKFIDLFKDGKINVDVPDLIYKQDSVGSKDGIYVIDDKVILKIGDEQITLLGEVGTTYVSFMGIQDVNAEERHTALTNIGFLASSLDDISLLNGIVYVEDELKLYIIAGGSVSEYLVDIPNPYTKLFVLAKNDNSEGAIVIQGSGILNSLAFDNMYIYSDYSNNYFVSSGNIYFNIGNDTYITISPSKTTVSNTLETNMLLSVGANSNTGFRLYVQGGLSTLEVDNLVVRNQEASHNLYPEYYYLDNNVIYTIEEDEESYESEEPIYIYYVTTLYTNNYKEGDKLYIFVYLPEITDDDEDESDSYVIYKLPFIVLSNEEDFKILLLYDTLDDKTKEALEEADLEEVLPNRTIFLVSGSSIPKSSKDGFDILDNDENVEARLGDLTDLGYDSNGLYAKLGVFDSAEYVNSTLSDDDNSTKFASTEWVLKKVQELYLYIDSKI